MPNRNKSKFVSLHQLGKLINNVAVTVIRKVLHPISVDIAQPHVVALAECFKQIHSDVRVAHLSYYGTIGPISQVNRAVFFGSVTSKRLSPFKRVDVIFVGNHYFVFIEVGHPMEESIQIASRISVESLAD